MGEERWETEAARYRIIVDKPYLVLMRGAWWRLDVNMLHVYGIELALDLSYVVAGVLLIISSGGAYWLLLREGLERWALPVAALLLALGIVLAVYGWLNRYRLHIYYGGGKIELRGGDQVNMLADKLRGIIRRVVGKG